MLNDTVKLNVVSDANANSSYKYQWCVELMQRQGI